MVAVILGAGWLARAIRSRQRWEIVYSLAAGVGGPLFEAGLSRLGGFHYAAMQQQVIGVPLWLPMLYLHIGLLGAPLYVALLAPPARAAGGQTPRQAKGEEGDPPRVAAP